MRGLQILVVLLVLVGLGAGACLFTVKETEVAIRLELGKLERADFKPGLHFRVPFYHSVRHFDSRIHTLDRPAGTFLTSEKKNLIVDYFAKWRIQDAGRFFTAAAGDPNQADALLDQIINKGLRDQFSKRTIQQAISGQRDDIMKDVTSVANQSAAEIGLEVVDVRVKRIDLSSDVSSSVYDRMRAERQRVAADLRARGAEAKERIQADADREATILKAEAERDAQKLRGEGDAKAAEIFAAAFGKNPEFYSFYRSLNAYRMSMQNDGDVMVISPDSEFFRYFKDPSGKSGK